jgi:hypothetical protein
MNQQLVLFPMITLILFTGAVGVALLFARIRAVREGSITPAYFKYNRGGKPPEYLLKVTHHFDNLLETPLLLYIAVVVLLQLQRVDSWYLLLVWGYVASRFWHAWVHLRSNAILRRKNAFLISYLLLFAIWTRLLSQLLFQP